MFEHRSRAVEPHACPLEIAARGLHHPANVPFGPLPPVRWVSTWGSLMIGSEGVDYVERSSPVAFRPTVDRLVTAIEGAGLTVFARIDHAAGARDAGIEMPPTIVLIYGNAKGGTPIMLAAPQSALDLPLRVLVRETGDGRTIVSFHPVAAMLRRVGVPEEMVTRLEPAQRLLVQAIQP